MIHATLQQLRLFEAVARNHGFTRAAEEVHLSQPAVSIQIKRLEEQLGVPLFEQLGKRIFVTQAGRELYTTCEEIFAQLREFEGTLDELKGEVAGPLRIAVVTTVKYFLPHYLGAFLRLHPKVDPLLKVTNHAGIYTRMEENVDDLYIVANPPSGARLVVYPFLEDELVLFAHPDHPLAGRKQIPVADLDGERFLFREPGSGIRKVLEAFLQQESIHTAPYMELGSGEAIKQGVMAGIGIGMLSHHSLRLEEEFGRVAVLDVEGLPVRRRWQVVHAEGKRLSRAASTFIRFLTSEPFPPQ